MSWTKKSVPQPSESFEVPPAGSHGAILVAIIDLGTQREDYQGTESEKHQVYLCWELTGCPMSGTTNNHLIGRKYTFSLQEKAALRQLIKSWRGKDLTTGEEYDILKLLGQKCLLSVSHKENGEKVYAQLGGISMVPAGMVVQPAKRKPVARHILETTPAPDWLPFIYGEKIEEVLARAKELKELKKPHAANGATSGLDAFDAAIPAPPDSEIPF